MHRHAVDQFVQGYDRAMAGLDAMAAQALATEWCYSPDGYRSRVGIVVAAGYGTWRGNPVALLRQIVPILDMVDGPEARQAVSLDALWKVLNGKLGVWLAERLKTEAWPLWSTGGSVPAGMWVACVRMPEGDVLLQLRKAAP